MTECIRFAVVGCGRIAKRHCELLGLAQIEHAKLVAVCDTKSERVESFKVKFNVPGYTDMHLMADSEEIDVFVVLTESGNHAEHVIALAKYGKHIVVEKPMALTVKKSNEMIEACEANNCRLFIVKQNRFNVPVVKMREALDAGRFGQLIMGTVRVRWCRTEEYYEQDAWRGTWRYDGGVLANQASHHIDLLVWMMGDVESVSAKGLTALADIEAEDTAVAVIKFKNGALGVVEATTAVRPKDLEGSLSLLGSGGSVEIGGFAVNKMLHWNFSQTNEQDNEILDKYNENPPNVYGFGHQAYYTHIVDALIENKPALIEGAQGRKSLEVLAAIYESIASGEEVTLPFEQVSSKLGENKG